MSWIIKEKSFYKNIALIAVPMACQNVISLGVNLMDTVMIGRLGDISLAASSISNQLFFIMTVLIFGISSGSNVMSAQYWGKGDKAMVRSIFSLAHKIAIALALFFMFSAIFFPEEILSIFSNDQAVIDEAVKYLSVVCFSYVFYAISSSTIMMLRSTGNVNMSVIVSAISLVTNVFWNWVLIFGNLGAPELGIVGAAYATVIARVQELIIVLFYTFYIDKSLEYKSKDFFTFDFSKFKTFMVMVTPILFNEFLWSMGASMITVIIGRLSTDFLAANSIVSVISQLVNVAVMGVTTAAAVVIGNNIGAGNYEQVKIMAKTLIIISFFLGLMAATALQIIRPFILGFYDNLSPATLEYISILIHIISVVTVFQSITLTNMMGVLRGGGDAKFVLFCDIIFMWAIFIPLGFLSAFVFGWSVPVVYIIIKLDEVCKTVLCTWRVVSGKWVKDVTV